jgi:hypothetical protein
VVEIGIDGIALAMAVKFHPIKRHPGSMRVRGLLIKVGE